MAVQQYFSIGLMSGTSLDGLDICYVKFQKAAHWTFEILHAETVPYDAVWEAKLKNATTLSAEHLLALNSEYGFYLGEKVSEFIAKFKIEKRDVIGSHGHTVFHQPEKSFTTQIGDGRAIKIKTNIPVVYDFRMQDVLLGGNGAPLVPIGDRLLFSDFEACVNLGGFSNVSFDLNEKRVAFDICPVNIVLNRLASNFGKKYDEYGNLARSGKFNKDLFEQFNALDFYKNPFPKSLGAEWVQENIDPLLEGISPEESLQTFTQHAAAQIVAIINDFKLKNVLFTGGGAYNSYLLELIQGQTDAEINVPEKQIIEYKEALIFAFMAVLKLRGENNVLSSATGSSHDHCTGILA